MQFCMHYAFESGPKVRLMLENASRYLRNGGKFVGTIPNSDQLLYVSQFLLLMTGNILINQATIERFT